MTVRLIIPMIVTALIAAAGLAWAQDKGIPGQSPPAKQSAPSESPDAQGHDVQSGKPETGEGPKGQAGGKKSTGEGKKGAVQPTSAK